jgi:hypothetical protein
MIKDLVKLASHLDLKGFKKEADKLDEIINKLAQMQGPNLTLVDRGDYHPESAPANPYDTAGTSTKQSSKKSLYDLNKLLSHTYKTACDLMKLECDPALAAYSSTAWTDKTQDMFSLLCNLANKPEAALSWKDYAKANGFTGDVTGMYDFVLVNMNVITDSASKLGLPAGSSGSLDELLEAAKGLKAPSAEKMVAPNLRDASTEVFNKGPGFGAGPATLASNGRKGPFGRD